jgi:hypothetical protein
MRSATFTIVFDIDYKHLSQPQKTGQIVWGSSVYY